MKRFLEAFTYCDNHTLSLHEIKRLRRNDMLNLLLERISRILFNIILENL